MSSREYLEKIEQDLPIGTYDNNNGSFVVIRKEGGIEEYKDGEPLGRYLPQDEIKTTLELDQVDNTSDADKPISDATEVALAGKLDAVKTIHKIPVHNRDTVFEDKRNTNTEATVRQALFHGIDCYGLEVTYSNNYRYNYESILPNVNDVDIEASVIVNGVVHPLYFGGSRSYTMSGGEVVTSDYLDVILYADDEVSVQTYYNAGTGDIPYGFRYTFPGANYEGKDALEYGVNKVDDVNLGYTGDTAKAWGFSMVQSTPTKSNNPAVLLVGDSIMDYGVRWDHGEGGQQGKDYVNSGYMATALKKADIKFTNISSSGEQGYNFFNSINARAPFTSGHDYVVGNYGINDLSNSKTLEELKAANIAIWQYYVDRGLKVIWTTLTPKTTSTDRWFTTTNQTTTSIDTDRLAYNDWLRNEARNEYPDLLFDVIDVTPVVETSDNKWRVYPIQHTGVAENSTYTNRIYDNTISDSVLDNEWGSEAYVIITSGTNFGEPENEILAYRKSDKRLTLEDNYPVPCDDTTAYYISRQPTNDGIHPRSGVVNTRTSYIVDTNIYN